MNVLYKALTSMTALLVLGSAIAVVWSKHESRMLFVELQRLQVERDRLDIEWGQLKIQQSYSATPGRVEQVARTELNMVTPHPSEVRILEAIHERRP